MSSHINFYGPYLLKEVYRVGHLLADPGWVDLDLECSIVLLWQ